MIVASRVLDDLRLVADDQVGLGPAEERGLALGVDRDGRVVVDPVGRQPGHVAVVAVGVAGDDPELLRAGLVEPDLGRARRRAASSAPWVLPGVSGRPASSQAEERPVLGRARPDPRPAAVRDRARRLAAGAGSPRARTGETRRPPGVAGDRPVVALGVVAEEREVEPVLAVGPAVAAAGVAARRGSGSARCPRRSPRAVGASASTVDRRPTVVARRRRPRPSPCPARAAGRSPPARPSTTPAGSTFQVDARRQVAAAAVRRPSPSTISCKPGSPGEQRRLRRADPDRRRRPAAGCGGFGAGGGLGSAGDRGRRPARAAAGPSGRSPRPPPGRRPDAIESQATARQRRAPFRIESGPTEATTSVVGSLNPKSLSPTIRKARRRHPRISPPIGGICAADAGRFDRRVRVGV